MVRVGLRDPCHLPSLPLPLFLAPFRPCHGATPHVPHARVSVVMVVLLLEVVVVVVVQGPELQHPVSQM